ncbi:hypothetical protein COO60DRAFT_1538822 [Scenedesmus sp. NREL 46B-D3]|nr:hypothetical protein COO60DRAFT_1538822 [Scenedesmus sp. NREL 46B-D3]
MRNGIPSTQCWTRSGPLKLPSWCSECVAMQASWPALKHHHHTHLYCKQFLKTAAVLYGLPCITKHLLQHKKKCSRTMAAASSGPHGAASWMSCKCRSCMAHTAQAVKPLVSALFKPMRWALNNASALFWTDLTYCDTDADVPGPCNMAGK